MKLAFLFPGQGSQKPNMLHHLQDHPVISEVMEQAGDILGESVYKLDSMAALESTISVQLSLLVSSVAVLKAFASEGVLPDIAAGHSVGSFSAAVACKAIEFADAIRLVKLRGQLMEQAFPSGYGMGVVTGIDERTMKEIVKSYFSEKDPIYLANINAPDQVTISGSITGVDRVIHHARDIGARKADVLNISVPSHCPLLQPVSVSLYKELSKVHFRSPIIPYACNRTARLLNSPEQIKEDLAFNLSHPVKWHDISSILCEHGTRLFIEMPPGNVLASLAKKALPGARALSVEENGFRNCLLLANRFISNQS
jgi:malonate decarboxylase epsilon subunit